MDVTTRKRRVAAAVGLAVTLAAGMAPASAAPSDGGQSEDPCTQPPEQRVQTEPVVACGTTVVVGTGGDTVRLRLPEDAVLDVTHNSASFSAVGLEGSGPMIGVYLSDNRLPLAEGGREVRAFSMGEGYYGGTRTWSGADNLERVGTGARYVIPAGDYSLYLLSDGGTVTVTLPFEGRPGDVAITPTRTVPAGLGPLANRAPDPGGSGQQFLVSMGRAADLGDEGGAVIVSGARQWSGPVPQNGDGTFCMYEFMPSNEDLAYYPGCPASYVDGGQGWEFIGVPMNGGFWASYQRRGETAVGFWHRTPSPNSPMGAVGAWFRYDASFPPAAALPAHGEDRAALDIRLEHP